MRAVRSVAVFVPVLAVVLGVGVPAGAAASAKKTCKLLKLSTIEKVLSAEARVDPDAQSPQVAGVKSCAYEVGPGLGEPGGGLVVLTHYTGALADNIANEFTSRVTKLGKGVVWEPLVEVAYVAKKGKLVGVNVVYTSNDPPTEELQDEAAELVRAAAKRA